MLAYYPYASVLRTEAPFDEGLAMPLSSTSTQKLVKHVNRKQWWHVPPRDPHAYEKRGKFFASTFSEAEFYGRPQDEPERVVITNPLIGDERTIARKLRVPAQNAKMTLDEISKHDAQWRDAALRNGYDSILLMTAKSFAAFRVSGKIPRTLELNVLTSHNAG